MEDPKEENEIREFCRNLVDYPQSKELLYTGSFFELPLKYFFSNISDLDIIIYPRHICALPFNYKTQPISSLHKQDSSEKPAQNIKRITVLRIYSKESHPGFTQLLLDGKSRKGKRYTRKHLGSDRVNKICHTAHIIRPSDRILETFKCLKYVLNDFSVREEITSDWVDAIRCPVWPEEAREWINRERRNGWPSKDLIESVVKSGCFLVPKPHQNNADDVGEWRISFSKAELSLIHSWNDVQMYIYHILRLVKNYSVTKCGGKDNCHLKTYHFKTLMLWSCEEKSPDFWGETNIETSLKELLCTMIEWLNRKECRNYFISDNNMFDFLSSDFCFENEIQIMISSVERIKLYIAKTVHLLSDRSTDVHVNIPNKLLLNMHLRFYYKFVLTSSLTERQRYKPLEACEETDCFRSKAIALYQALSIHKDLLTGKTRNLCDKKLIHFALDRIRFSRDKTIDGNSKAIFSSSENGHGMTKKILNAIIGKAGDVADHPLVTSVSELTRAIANAFVEYMNDGFEDPFYFLSSAYLVNFHYTAFNEEAFSMEHCREALMSSLHLIYHYENLTKKRTFWNGINDELLSVIITKKWVTIFDKYIQAVYGFYVLGSVFLNSNGRNVNGCENRDIVVHINAVDFLKYVQIQCNRKLSAAEGLVIDDRNDIIEMQRLSTLNSTTALLCSALCSLSKFGNSF